MFRKILTGIAAVFTAYVLINMVTYAVTMPDTHYHTSTGMVVLEAGIDYPTLLEWLNPFSDLSKYE